MKNSNKIIALGDTHGKQIWRDVVKQEGDADHIVFIGDYMDDFPPTTPEDILINFLEILSFKRHNQDKVTLLVGNHDFHYMNWSKGAYSGYNAAFADIYQYLLHEEGNLHRYLDVAYVHRDILFTHAGVTRTWANNTHIDMDREVPFQLRSAIHTAPEKFDFIVGGSCSPYGDDKHQGPLWVRPDSLEEDRVLGWRQVVGHTKFPDIKIGEVTYIDCLDTSPQYLIIEDGEMRIGHVK